MDRLRSAEGCPWDAEQTHETLVRYLIEETYEVVDAIEIGTQDDLVEELGDLLLQVVFHSRIGEEEQPRWDVDDVCRGISDKLIRRHPHVFAGVAVDGVELERQWHELKSAEKQRTSLGDGIPRSMPALGYAAKIAKRHTDAGVEMPVGWDESRELRQLIASFDDDEQVRGEQLGQALFALAAAAANSGLDPEGLLRQVSRDVADHIPTA